MTALTLREMDAARPPASDLLDAMVAEIHALYPKIPGAEAPSGTAADLSPPGGAFLVGFEEGEAVCAGGLKRLSPDVAEIKRMYVVPSARRRGFARQLLAALEDAARARGYGVVRLDTGVHQPHAVALYTSAGYVTIDDYNDNQYASYWGEKRL